MPGTRPDDGDIGRHGEVVVQGPEAYLFYFTHPAGPKAHTEPGKHRSSLQVARLELRDGALVCDRDKPFPLELVPPSGFKPAKRPESPLTLETPDAKLAAAFDWAKGQALDYVYPAAVHGDPVGDWYEAALPSRFAFCMRDVSHQATGAHALGLAAFNRNMLGKFARGISPSRDFCSYWEIDKWDRPAPVDYKSDQGLLVQPDGQFRRPRRLLAAIPVDRRRGVRHRSGLPRVLPPDRRGIYRGLGQGRRRHTRASPGIRLSGARRLRRRTVLRPGPLRLRPHRRDGPGFRFLSPGSRQTLGNRQDGDPFFARAEALRKLYEEGWWSEEKGRYADGRVQGGALVYQDVIWNGVFPLYFGFIPAGPRRDLTLRRIVDAKPEGIEIESYLPEILYRYGEDEAAYARVLALTDPAKERREYPEVPFAVVGAVATGLMGVRPDATVRTVETRSGLTSETPWAELRNLPVFDGLIDIRHEARHSTTLTARSGREFVWRAVFEGVWDELTVDGVARKAEHGTDEAGRAVSWVDVPMSAGRTATVSTPAARRPDRKDKENER